MFRKKQTGILNSIGGFSCVSKEDSVTLHEHYKNKQIDKQKKSVILNLTKREKCSVIGLEHIMT